MKKKTTLLLTFGIILVTATVLGIRQLGLAKTIGLYISSSFEQVIPGSQQKSTDSNANAIAKNGAVLGLSDEFYRNLDQINFNLPSFFNDYVNVGGNLTVGGNTILEKDATVSGSLAVDQDLTVRGKRINFGTAIVSGGNLLSQINAGSGVSVSTGNTPTITNTGVLSLQGKSGALTLEEGDNIKIDGLKISAVVPDVTVDTFKNFAVSGQSTVTASGNDTFTFASGSGITLTTDATTKQLTIASTSVASGWSTGAGTVYLSTNSDNVGIGTSSPTSKLQVVGTGNISSDLTLGGNLIINGDSIADFSGNGLAVSANSLGVGLTASGTSSSTMSNSGLEVSSSGLSLLRGCANGELLKWNSGTSLWGCSTDDGGATGIINVKENDVLVTSTASTVDYLGSDFNVVESPSGEVNISIDYPNSQIARKNIAETISGAWAFSNGLSVSSGLNNNNGGITNTGTIAGATGITSSGTITLSSFTTNGGLLYTNGSGTVSQSGAGTSTQVLHGGTTPSYSALSLTADVTGTLPTTNGGTGLTAYTTGDIIYASATNTLSKLAVGGTGTVLTVAGGVPSWANITGSGGICSDCIVSDPSASQTITPTVGTATGLSIAQAVGGSVDVFNVTNNAGSTKYLRVNSSGNVSIANNLDITGTSTFTGNLIGSGSPTLSGFGTINGATITGGSVSGGSLTGGTYTSSGATVIGNYTTTINNGGTFNVYDGTQNIFTVTDAGTVGNISNIGAINASGTVTSNALSVNGGNFAVNSSGAVTAATGITSSGTITLSGLSTGIVHSNSSGVLSSSALNLAGGVSEVTGVLPETKGGTNQSTYTTGDIIYASATNTLAKLGIGGSGNVLTVSGGLPSWQSVPGICPTCVIQDPSVTQTITPTVGTATGISVAQASAGSVDIFNVTNNAGSTKYLQVNSSGNVSMAGNLAVTGTTNFTGNITGSSSPTLSGFGTINGATLSGGTLSGGTVSGGTYSGTGLIATGNYTAQIGNTSAFNIYDGTQNIFTLTDGGTVGNITNIGSIVAGGTISGLTGISSSGTITLSTFSTNGGILYTNGSGTVAQSGAGTSTQVLHGGTTPSYSALSLTADVTGTLGATNGGTGLATYTTGDIIYASATNTLSKLAVGGSGTVLTVSGGVPSWASITGGGGICSDCIISDPSASQTITPTVATATGLTIAQASSGSVDVFNVTNNAGTIKYLQINSSGNVITEGTLAVTPAGAFHGFLLSPGAAAGIERTATLTTADLSANRTYTFPDSTGTICLTSGNCAGAGSGVTTPGGTTDTIPKFTAAQTLGDSSITDNGTVIGLGNDINFSATTPTISIGNGNTLTVNDGTNSLLSLADNGTNGTLTVNTLAASNIGAYTLTGNITGSGTPTLSGLGTINSATISGGTLSGGSVIGGSLTGGTYTATGATVTGNYTTQINNGGNFNVYDGTNNIFTVTDAGAVGNLTNIGAITANGTITFSSFTTNGGLLYTNASGTVAQSGAGTSTQVLHGGTTPTYSALSLSTDVTGTLGATNGGTGLSTFTTGDIIYASATNTLSKRAIGSSGDVLSVSGGVPSWATVASLCSTCIITNPGATQTITPTIATATGLSIAQASAGSADIFNVTNNGGTTKYIRVNSAGDVSMAGNLAVTGTTTLTGNLIGSASPTLSGFGTINGATLSGGSLSGGSVTGGTYTSSGFTVTGNYTGQINNGGSFNVYDGTNNIFTVTDAGSVGDLTNIGAITANGAITFSGVTSGTPSNGVCLNASNVLVTCSYGGGSMSSFTAAGDSGTPQTISNASTLSVLGGTNGIDTVASATGNITLNLDTTEIGTTTFGSGSAATWTFDASAGTDTTIAFGNNTQTFTTGTATFSGDVTAQGTTGLTLSGAGAGATISGTGNHTISTTNAGSNLTINTTTTGALSLDSGTTGTVSLGNGNNAKTVNIGSGTAGNTINIAGTGATGADTVNIGTGGTGADTINLGSSASTTALNFTSGTGAQTFSSSVATGTGSTSAYVFNANSLSSGTGLNLSSTSTALSSGTLASIDWSPASSTTATGDLLAVNIGSNGNIGNIFNVKDSGSSVFSVSESAITANLPTNFTSPGDVSFAYDLQFTNPTASYIKSIAGLTLESGESFNSSDLTLRTFNSGQLVLDTPGGVTVQNAPVNIANSSGSNVFTVSSAGAITAATGITSSGTITFSGISSGSTSSGLCLNASNQLITCTYGGGSMSSFTAAGDSGTPQTISNSSTLSVLGGTNGIDTVASATGNITLNLDTTEVGTTTFGSGSAATWTFDASAGTDTTIAFGNNTQTFTTGTATFTGNVGVNGGDLTTSNTTATLFNTNATTLSLGGAATTALNLGTGNTAYTAINIGTGTGGNGINIGTNNTVADTIGIGSALDTLTLAGTTGITGATTINGSGSAATNIGTGTSTGTITIGRTVSTDLALNDANWNITGAGAANFASIGATTPGTGAFTTLSSTGATTLGNNSSTVAVDTTSWDVSTAGVFSGLTGITSSGIIALTPGSTNDINLTLNNASGSFLNLAGLATGTTSSGLCLDASNNVITCTVGSGSMSSFTAAGDSGTPQTISNASTLSVLGGTNGIDTVASATGNITLNLDTTEIGTTTFGSGSAATWTFDASAGTDTSIAFGNNTQTFTTGTATFSGDVTAQGTTGLTLSGTGAGATISGTGNHTISTTNAGSNLTINTTTTGTLSLDSGTTGTVSLGNGNNSKTVNIGSGTAGNTINIAGTGATGADTVNIGTGGTGADTINLGNSASTTALNFTSGTGAQSFTSSVVSGTGTSSAFAFNANALTTGTGLNLASSTLTSGTLASINSTSTAVTSGGLMALDWSPGSATTGTGDLFSLNIGSNGTLANIFNVKDSGSSVFSISESAITANLPTSFNAAGDVSFANNIAMTNQTASYIRSNAPLYLEAGETFESNDLTLRTYNSGQLVIDAAGGVNINTVGYVFPSSQAASSGYVLSNDGSGNLSWAAGSTGTVTGTGSANRVAYWSGTSALTSSANYTIDPAATSGTTLALSNTGLTTGSLTSFTGTNTATTNTALTQNLFAITNAQATNANTNGIVGLAVNFTNAPTIAGNTEYAARIQNQVTTNTTDNAVAALLLLDNADTSGTGSTVVTDALRITNSGAIASGITNGINFGSITIANGINFSSTPTTNYITGTNFSVTAAGLGTFADDVAVNGGDITTSASAATLFNTNATTLSLGGAATTALNIGNGSGAYTAINLGSGSGTHTINIAGTGATSADTINIGTGGTAADTINLGSSASTTALNFTSGTGAQSFTSSVVSGTGTSSAFAFNANALTTGTGLNLVSSTLTSGTLASINSTSTAVTSGGLMALDWSPGSSTTATGDLLSLNIGTNGNIGNLFNVKDTGTSIFSISETQITSAIPQQFTAAGDVGIAYDLAFTNQTASYIKSNAPLTIDVGESFESNDLTLQTYNSGDITLDTGATGAINLVNAVNFGAAQSFTAADTTPDVSGGSHFVTTGTATITDFDAGTSGTLHAGQLIFVECATAVTFDVTSSGLIGGASDIVCGNGDMTTWLYDGTDWRLVAWMDQTDTQTGADLAEWYASNETLAPGDVVSIDKAYPDEAYVKKSATQRESSTMGVVSTKPGKTLGEPVNGKAYAIALAGRVPVKVSTINGPIEKGDYLTTSNIPGVATKATIAGPTIGKALTSYSGNGVGEVTVFVNISWYDPDAYLASLSGTNITPTGTTDKFSLTNAAGNLVSRIGLFSDAAISNISAGFIDAKKINLDGQNLADLIKQNTPQPQVAQSSGTFTQDDAKSLLDTAYHLQTTADSLAITRKLLAYSNVDIQGDLQVFGQTFIKGKATFEDETIFNKLVTFVSNSIFKGKVSFEDQVAFNKDTAGIAIIEKNSDSVTINFDKEYDTVPLVSATMVHEGEATASAFLKTFYVTEKTKKGFTIKLDAPQSEDVSFNWIAIAVNDPKISKSSDATPAPSVDPIVQEGVDKLMKEATKSAQTASQSAQINTVASPQ